MMAADTIVPRDSTGDPAAPVPKQAAPMPGLFGALNPPLPAWSKARVWVIGASMGIGEATARALLAEGAKVALSARRAERLNEIAGGSERALVLAADVGDAASIARAWATIGQRWGACDLVLIVAGTHQEMRAWELTEARAAPILDVNLNGVIRCCAAVVPTLLAQGHGAIGVVSSLAGYGGLPKAIVYGASKAAASNFTEALYLDLRPRGIGVYLINPGFVKTPLTDRNRFRMPALISATEAAEAILAGLRAGRFEIHFPRRFSLAMKLLRLLPYRLYFAAVRRATGL
jgi:short-subunit dehydrogenase